MGSLFTVGYSLLLLGAGVYAILIGKNWLPGKGDKSDLNPKNEPEGNKTQYIIAGVILIYFGASSLYTLFV